MVDDKEQVNSLSTKDLKNLFKLRQGTPRLVASRDHVLAVETINSSFDSFSVVTPMTNSNARDAKLL